MTDETSLYACLYVREFPAQALLRLRPDLRATACVVIAGEAPSEEVCSLNTKARLSGMKHGDVTRRNRNVYESDHHASLGRCGKHHEGRIA